MTAKERAKEFYDFLYDNYYDAFLRDKSNETQTLFSVGFNYKDVYWSCNITEDSDVVECIPVEYKLDAFQAKDVNGIYKYGYTPDDIIKINGSADEILAAIAKKTDYFMDRISGNISPRIKKIADYLMKEASAKQQEEFFKDNKKHTSYNEVYSTLYAMPSSYLESFYEEHFGFDYEIC